MPKPASVAWISLRLVLDCGMTVGETQNLGDARCHKEQPFHGRESDDSKYVLS